MGTFGTGFATGFFNKLSSGIDERNADARDYFNKQVEMARTTGLENRNRSRAAADQSIMIAKRLEAMGVPKDIIMAQADMNPAGLGDFLTQMERLSLESNVPVDEGFFRGVAKLSGTFKAPDEDYNTFFSRMYNPIVDAANEDPEGFAQDQEGSMFAAAFGYNAMDRARGKLSTVEVAPGLTAEQAIAYGDNPKPNTSGASVVTLDPAAVRAATGSKDDISASEVTQITDTYTKFFTVKRDDLGLVLNADGTNTYKAGNPADEAALNIEAKRLAYQQLSELYSGNEGYLHVIRVAHVLDEAGNPVGAPAKATGEPLPAPPPVTGDGGSLYGQPPPVAPPVPTVEDTTDYSGPVTMDERLRFDYLNLKDFVDNEDGTVTFTNQKGESVNRDRAEFRKALNTRPKTQD